MESNRKKLTDHDRTRLRGDFIVPLIVAQIFAGTETLDDMAEYTIHDMIGDLKPDCGLLCIALCATEIAAHYPRTAIAATLAMESERVIAEFGALWLHHGLGARADALQTIRASLVHIPEDLETLADLLDATQGELPAHAHTARTLCDMLALQARAHAESAEEELYNINLMPLPRPATPAPAMAPSATIIPFPARL